MNIKVSVIVPTLNSSMYIKECIKSILTQTLEEIEILVVDAGSTDATLEILEQYQKTDNRIQLIHSDKKSYGYQMNLGIRLAKGLYVGIVESDDAIDREMYCELYNVAIENDLDFVKADYREVRTDSNSGEYAYRTRKMLKDKNLYNTILNPSKMPELLLPDIVAIWCGIYKKAFIVDNNIQFNETPGASFQDTGVWAWTQIIAQKSIYLNKCFYRYRVDNPNSSTFQANKCFCICDEFEFIRNNIDKVKLKEFGEMLSWIFYRKYKTNIERTPLNLRGVFYERMAEDISRWNREFQVTGISYYPEEWKDIKQIIASPETYLEQKRIEKMQFIEFLKNESGIVIYGAGRVGKTLAKEIGPKKILCFAVTGTPNENNIDVDGVSVPIKSVHSMFDEGNVIFVISSKLANLRLEMLDEIKKKGNPKVVMTPFGAYD